MYDSRYTSESCLREVAGRLVPLAFLDFGKAVSGSEAPGLLQLAAVVAYVGDVLDGDALPQVRHRPAADDGRRYAGRSS